MPYTERMRMLSAMLLIALAASSQTKNWSGTWTATAGSRTLSGSWSAAEDDAAATASGGWTLTDPSGTALAAGTWSARKGVKAWQGSWQARAVSGQVYSGTWRAQTALAPTEPLTAMFEAALSGAIQGAWQAGAAQGAWSIRAYMR